jgi:hypothetical protein
MRFLAKLLKAHSLLIFLSSISLFISYINFRSGTWLTGWDNLHPEFDFFLNIKRSVYSVWQEYQGLGLLGGMGHATDLPRQILLLIISIFVNPIYLRYIWTSIMLLIGPVGVYIFLRNLLKSNEHENLQKTSAFLGGLFYLLNLGTVQVFYVPFEAFVTHYGFLPWLINFAVLYLDSGRKKNLSLFIIFSVLSMSMSYVPTLFVVYILALTILMIGAFFRYRSFTYIKRSIVIAIATFIINAYWLLPFLHFTFISSDIVGQAHQNFMATEDVYLRNKEFGRWQDVAILRGFWMKFVDFDLNGTPQYMNYIWRDHLDLNYVQIIGYASFIIILTGLLFLFKSKGKFSISFKFLFIFTFSMLAVDTFPFDILNHFIRDNFHLFNQVFRVPFTKFGILAAFSFSILFAYGIYSLSKLTTNIDTKFSQAFVLAITASLVVFSSPTFFGGLFYDYVRLEIPEEYFQVMDFFGNQDRNTRIANFPQHSYWGWNHFDWGYRGSGFLWYGIEQPILDRAFDGYSYYNENYYWEVSLALYSADKDLFGSILDKYNIDWVLVDQNVRTYSSYRALNFDQLLEFLESSDQITLTEEYGNIKIFQVNKNDSNNFITIKSNLSNILPKYKWNNMDTAFKNGNYISSDKKLVNTYLPFRSLFSARLQDDLEFFINTDYEYIYLETDVPVFTSQAEIDIPKFLDIEIEQYDEIDQKERQKKYPQIYLNNVLLNLSENSEYPLKPILNHDKDIKLKIKIPKIEGIFAYDSDDDNDLLNLQPKSCDQFNKGIFSQEILTENNQVSLLLKNTSSSNCLDLYFPELPHRLSYLISIEADNIEGKPLFFSLINDQTKHLDIETYLPKTKGNISYYVIPPMQEFGKGYILHLDNISLGRQETINLLKRITINPFPYRFVTNMKINISEQFNPTKLSQISFQVKHPNTSLYLVNLNQNLENNSTLILSQSYDDGWKAYSMKIPNPKSQIQNLLGMVFPFWFGSEIKDHVLVNNWQNGWILSDNSQQITNNNNRLIVIVYLPQYLQYIGFGMYLLLPLFFIPFKNKLNTSKRIKDERLRKKQAYHHPHIS